MGAAFWAESIRTSCIIAYRDRDTQKRGTAQEGDGWNCPFRGHGLYCDYLNECLPGKEFHLKNEIGRKRNWAKEREFLQSTWWQ